MSYVIVLVMAVVFAVVLAVGQSAYWAYAARAEREQTEMLRRLNMLGDIDQGGSLFRERARDAAATALGGLGEHLQECIVRADSQITVSTLLVQMAIAALVASIALFLLGGPIVAIVGLAAAIVPYGLLRHAASSRAAKLVEQLPEALDLMARSLQAGLGLNEAFRTCAEEMPLPVAAEFGRVFEEVRFGREYRDAFANLIRRNPSSFDLRLFVSSVLLQRETGGNLIEILDSISNTIRGRFLFQAKVKALTSEARFSAIILGTLPLFVACIISFVNPTYLLPLINDPLGNLALLFFFTMYSVGGFLMYNISQVEV